MGGGGAGVSSEEDGVGGGGVVVEVGGLVGRGCLEFVAVVRGVGGVNVETGGRRGDRGRVLRIRGGWRERGVRKACIVLSCGRIWL